MLHITGNSVKPMYIQTFGITPYGNQPGENTHRPLFIVNSRELCLSAQSEAAHC